MDFIDALRSPAVDLQVCAKNLEAFMDNFEDRAGEFLNITNCNNHYTGSQT